ncbi:cation:proton antiporter [Serinicoccus sp. CNJ-927]|uniref:DUF4040 family protein n=1 Tax=Serinicoccus sp. CNJ-927 TaxID=1904970 RepID=UPI000969DB27|nr:DUF4040 family protein [Serinicoccus sp. CNJ-927]OLT44819.1 cation:proton antiporter [Serinicoccus sp. CNJ-927]
MSLLWTLVISAVTVVATFPLTRLLGRHAGWPIAALYLAAAGAYWPAATEVMHHGTVAWSMPWVPTLGLELSLRADGLGTVFTFIALVIGAIVLAYSTAYLKPGRNLTFYFYMAMFTVSMVGLVLADDLILLFLCWELTSLASFFLIARSGYAGEAASMRTLLITFLGGLGLLAAVTAIIVRTGTTTLSEALAHEVWDTSPGFTATVALLVILAAFTKSAQFPFHVWLPDAMAAATPVSAYLHAAAVVKAGIFLLMRFSPAFHDVLVWNVLLVVTGLVTCAIGGWFALQKTDLKKLMAYSTVSQLGLIVATIGIGTEYALAAAILHVIAHALFKSGLFMMVGVVDHAAGTRDVRRMPVLSSAMPVAFWVTVLGCASMAGVPPMLGFVSKESILTAMLDSPFGTVASWAAFLGVALTAVLTFAYCAKIVFNGFYDGRGAAKWPEDRPLHTTPWALGTFAAIPIVVGLPLAFVVGILDTPVGRATAAMLPADAEEPHPHLALWHGLNLELFTTLAIIAVGVLIILRRRFFFPAREHDTFSFDGADVIKVINDTAADVGQSLAMLVRADNPTRHVAVQFIALGALVLGGVTVLVSGDHLLPVQEGLVSPVDVVVLVVIALAVGVLCRANSRLAAVVALSTVGVAVTVQIFALGAPDVGMTQLLVEALTVLMIMLVLQRLPQTFGRGPRWGNKMALLLAAIGGLSAGVATWALTGRRDRSDIALYYLEEGPVETGGDNVVNTILVEFRALDTFGELTVLGMAAVAMVAIVSTVRDKYLDPPPEADRNHVPLPEVPLRERGSTAYRAVTEAWGNAVPLQLLVRVTAPLLAIISAILFLRGHNAPGGGFIAALVGSSIVALIYLSTSRDRMIGPPRLPLRLVAIGVLIAVATGLLGLVGHVSFLEPLHTYIGSYKLISPMAFDLGVYLAVLGLVMEAFNLLGATGGREGTRERADESVEGEISGPMDTSRGERYAETRLGIPNRASRYLQQDLPPRRGGDRP